MDYSSGPSSSSSYVSAISAAAAAAAGLVFNSNPCHFSPGNEQSDHGSPGENQQECQQHPSLAHHLHQQQSNYNNEELIAGASPSTPSPGSSSPSLQQLYHQRYNLNHQRASPVSTAASTSSNSLAVAAAASLFGGGFHGNGAFSSSFPSGAQSRPTASAHHYGAGASFFSPNGIHLQGNVKRITSRVIEISLMLHESSFLLNSHIKIEQFNNRRLPDGLHNAAERWNTRSASAKSPKQPATSAVN